jgi:subtilisin family serine protease
MGIPAPRLGRVFVSLAVAAIAVAFGSTASPQAPASRRSIVINGHEAVSGEVLVKLRGMAAAARGQLEQQLDADDSRELASDLGIRRIHSRTFDVETLIAFLRADPSVAYVEPNYILHAAAVPDEPQFVNLWGLRNAGQSVNGMGGGSTGADIHATGAWNLSTGSRRNVVAVIDTGFDYNHPDLKANVWSAPAAFSVTIDGVTTTCAAGTHGFNAITSTCDPLDDNDHGSHVAGTIGAVGQNSRGVVGVNWTASIMASKFLDATGNGTLANAINALEFAIQAKTAFASTAGANVRVLNNSWVGGGFSQALLDEINRARTNGMLFVAAAGNDSSNNDAEMAYPADYTHSGATSIISVAATDNDDQLASFSNYGRSLVHLGAPGVNILSTTRGNTYRYFSGTSMATPHVSGAAALVLSKCALSTSQLKTAILHNVDVLGSLTGWVSSNGRLNVEKALRSCTAAAAAPAAPTHVTATAGNTRVVLSWSAAAGATSYNVYRRLANGSYHSPLKAGITSTTYTNSGLTNGTTYYYAVAAVTASVQGSLSAEVAAKPNGAPVPPAALTARSGPTTGEVSLAWTTSGGATSYRVKRSLYTGGSYSTVTTAVTGGAYVNKGLHSGTRYYYIVSAIGASGESAASNQASAIAK